MPHNPEPIMTTLYTLHLHSMTGQGWHDTIGLLQLRVVTLEQRLIALEVANKVLSEQLDEVEARCHALWDTDVERRWEASTAKSVEA